MKRKVIYALTSVATMVMLITGCGGSSSVETKNTNDSQVVESAEQTPETNTTATSEETIEENAEKATTEVEISTTESAVAQSENQTSVNSKMEEDFYYIIEDTFELIDSENLVVVGMNMNSPMYAGAEVDILSSEGRISTQILGIEEATNGLVDHVVAESSVGVMLANLTKEQVKSGDMIVLRDKGQITDEANAVLVMTPVGADMTYAELTEGQQVQVVLYSEPIVATVAAIDVYEESGDGDIVTVTLQFNESIACINYQALFIYDENGDMIAAGRFGTIKESVKNIKSPRVCPRIFYFVTTNNEWK